MLIYNPTTNEAQRSEQISLPPEDKIGWVHFTANKKEDAQNFLQKINIHPLSLKHMMSFSHSPKIDVYGDQAFISAFAILPDLNMIKINILVTSQLIVTLSEGADPVFKEIEETLYVHPTHMVTTGHILYHIFDRIVSDYLNQVEKISEEIIKIDKKIFIHPFANEIGHKVYQWKTKLLHLKTVIEHQEDVIKTIGNSSFPLINKDSGFYFQDVLHNFSYISSTLVYQTKQLTGIFELQLSLKSDHTNAIMKVLTLVSVTFIPLSFIAGVYGMNFEIPEIKWKYGYLYVLGLMLLIALSIVYYFKRKGWWGKGEKV